MKHQNLFILIIGLCISCTNETSSNSSSDKQKATDSIPAADQITKGTNGEFDFLEGSEDSSTAYKGYFQGVEKSDSSGPYVYKEVYKDSLTYELVFVPKSQDKSAITLEHVRKAKSDNYKEFRIYSFVYAMRNPDKMEDYHADNVSYPVTLKSYVRKDATWKLLSETRVENLKELSQQKIKAIFFE